MLGEMNYLIELRAVRSLLVELRARYPIEYDRVGSCKRMLGEVIGI